jgi:hypothetical protein
MKRILACGAVLLAMLAANPAQVQAATMHCSWWWTHSIIEYNTITGEYTETHYFRRVCLPDEPY